MPIETYRNAKAGQKSVTAAVGLSDGSFGFTAAQLANAQKVTICSLLAAEILWDGSTPTATFGIQIPANGVYVLVGNVNINSLLMFAASASNITAILEW
jgi:hypothetical protein